MKERKFTTYGRMASCGRLWSGARRHLLNRDPNGPRRRSYAYGFQLAQSCVPLGRPRRRQPEGRKSEARRPHRPPRRRAPPAIPRCRTAGWRWRRCSRLPPASTAFIGSSARTALEGRGRGFKFHSPTGISGISGNSPSLSFSLSGISCPNSFKNSRRC